MLTKDTSCHRYIKPRCAPGWRRARAAAPWAPARRAPAQQRRVRLVASFFTPSPPASRARSWAPRSAAWPAPCAAAARLHARHRQRFPPCVWQMQNRFISLFVWEQPCGTASAPDATTNVLCSAVYHGMCPLCSKRDTALTPSVATRQSHSLNSRGSGGQSCRARASFLAALREGQARRCEKGRTPTYCHSRRWPRVGAMSRPPPDGRTPRRLTRRLGAVAAHLAAARGGTAAASAAGALSAPAAPFSAGGAPAAAPFAASGAAGASCGAAAAPGGCLLLRRGRGGLRGSHRGELRGVLLQLRAVTATAARDEYCARRAGLSAGCLRGAGELIECRRRTHKQLEPCDARLSLAQSVKVWRRGKHSWPGV